MKNNKGVGIGAIIFIVLIIMGGISSAAYIYKTNKTTKFVIACNYDKNNYVCDLIEPPNSINYKINSKTYCINNPDYPKIFPSISDCAYSVLSNGECKNIQTYNGSIEYYGVTYTAGGTGYCKRMKLII